METLLTNEESYAERRELFKNIWDTAMHVDANEVTNKPKVIRTLRLDEVDKCAGKKKKQRLRNLRAVCNRLLDFCDRQEADDLFYEQMAETTEAQASSQQYVEIKPKKLKHHRGRKNVRKAKSSVSPRLKIPDPTPVKITFSDRNDEFFRDFGVKTSRYSSPTLKKTVVKKSTVMSASKKAKSKHSPTVNNLAISAGSHRKVVKKKQSKRKKQSDLLLPSGIL